MQAVSQTLERIYALPHELRGRIDLGHRVSLLALVEETGYSKARDAIDVSLINSGLRERRAILDAWLRYSSEKKETWGWFFEVDSRGKYAVGLKTGFSERTRCEIPDPWDACASFIKEELEAILGARHSHLR